MKNKYFKLLGTATLAAVLLIPGFSKVDASNEGLGKEIKTNVSFDGGALSLDAAGVSNSYDFGRMSIPKIVTEGPQEKNSGPASFTIKDHTGTGEGYNLSIAADQFTDGNKKLDKGVLLLGDLKLTKGNEDINIGNFTGTSIDGNGSVTLVSAELNKGMGDRSFKFDNFLKFKVSQKDAKRGFYNSNVVLTLSSSPNFR